MNVSSRALSPTAAMVAAALFMSGCADPGPSNGSVRVEIVTAEYPGGQAAFPVTVLDGTGAVVYDEVLRPGESVVVEDVLSGEVTVSIEGQCDLTATVNGGQMEAIVEPGHCTVG
ncbi:hypothetical protein [Agromyces sp. NPDC055658]